MQTIRFTELVDQLYSLSYEELVEAKRILEDYLAERQRDEYVKNYNNSIKLEEDGRLHFTSNIDELLAQING